MKKILSILCVVAIATFVNAQTFTLAHEGNAVAEGSYIHLNSESCGNPAFEDAILDLVLVNTDTEDGHWTLQTETPTGNTFSISAICGNLCQPNVTQANVDVAAGQTKDVSVLFAIPSIVIAGTTETFTIKLYNRTTDIIDLTFSVAISYTGRSYNTVSIACVSVDNNNHNVVRWEQRDVPDAISYNVYRDGLGGFSLVANVPYNDSLSEYSWVDEEYNTSTQACSYKISLIYNDGSESILSDAHTTMHLQINQGQGNTRNLTWTPYIGFPYDGYRIYRGDSADDMSLMATIGSSNTTYSDSEGSSTTLYQIEVVPSSNKSLNIVSRSNIASASPSTPNQYNITVVSHNPEMGTVSGGGVFDGGTVTTITAEPYESYHFVQWNDGNTQRIRTITVTGNATYTAYFDRSNGIDDITADNVKIYSRGSEIVIEGAYNSDALIYDVMGRIIHKGRIEAPIYVNAMGVYMVKVGDRQPQKVVVR